MLADARGRPIVFALTPDQAAELAQAPPLLDFLPGTPIGPPPTADLGATPASHQEKRGPGSLPRLGNRIATGMRRTGSIPLKCAEGRPHTPMRRVGA